jgi:hypothetical protein
MDWASMAHSLEVRVPLVDAHLLRKIAPVLVTRRERGKGILADAPRPPMPFRNQGYYTRFVAEERYLCRHSPWWEFSSVFLPPPKAA